MEDAIKTLVTTFLKSSGGRENMTKKAAQKMVQKQLGASIEDTNSSSAVKEMLSGLDDNNDDKISFGEYLGLVGYIAQSMSERQVGGEQVAQ